jgi:hypothetical protein
LQVNNDIVKLSIPKNKKFVEIKLAKSINSNNVKAKMKKKMAKLHVDIGYK